MRNIRRQDRIIDFIGEDQWKKFDVLDKRILVYMSNHKNASRSDLERYINRSSRTIGSRLRKMVSLNIIKPNGSSHDPKLTYSLLLKEF